MSKHESKIILINKLNDTITGHGRNSTEKKKEKFFSF